MMALVQSNRRVWLAMVLSAAAFSAHAATYHLHPMRGDDDHSGLSPQAPFRSLARVSGLSLQPGDRVLLAAGQTFAGQLVLADVAGTVEAPIVISTYTDGNASGDVRATIDAAGQAAGVLLRNAAHVRIENLHLTGNGGGMAASSAGDRALRCGVLVLADRPGDYAGFRLTNLVVRDVFLEEPGFVRDQKEVRTANGTQHYGWGIRFIARPAGATLRDVVVEDCEIANVSHTGLKFTAPTNGIRNVTVERLRVRDTGGPGVQMSGLRGGRFRELDVNGSGSTNDTRNWGRGSGLWTWQTSDVVIERSRFQNANGPGDSAGVHIDYHCRDIIVQHILSANNAGGFCEVLGNNHNIAYRYNISVNDGHRVKGRNGAFQEGKIFWLSGYTGDRSPRIGPFNTYFYNNTIFVREDIVAKFTVAPTARGVLIANNIFHIQGRSLTVPGDQNRPDVGPVSGISNVVFRNNLFLRRDNWPTDSGLADTAPLVGDPEFANGGGLRLEDYLPQNVGLIRDRGLVIERLPGDPHGLPGGLRVERDILGNEITGRPDLGAVDLPGPAVSGAVSPAR
ncbi:MAG: right-handed parallel beta-helix repeat-containing protein [Limisphaerales bacterium]